MSAAYVVVGIMAAVWITGCFAIHRLGRHPSAFLVTGMTASAGAAGAILFFLLIAGAIR